MNIEFDLERLKPIESHKIISHKSMTIRHEKTSSSKPSINSLFNNSTISSRMFLRYKYVGTNMSFCQSFMRCKVKRSECIKYNGNNFLMLPHDQQCVEAYRLFLKWMNHEGFPHSRWIQPYDRSKVSKRIHNSKPFQQSRRHCNSDNDANSQVGSAISVPIISQTTSATTSTTSTAFELDRPADSAAPSHTSPLSPSSFSAHAHTRRRSLFDNVITKLDAVKAMLDSIHIPQIIVGFGSASAVSNVFPPVASTTESSHSPLTCSRDPVSVHVSALHSISSHGCTSCYATLPGAVPIATSYTTSHITKNSPTCLDPLRLVSVLSYHMYIAVSPLISHPVAMQI